METGGDLSFDTARTVLVPAPLYEKGSGEEYLRFGGMALAKGEVAVESEPQEGIVAVMGIGADVWAPYKDRYERGEVAVTSPLLRVAASRGRGRREREVNILLTSANIYMAVWDGGLRMAEALPDNSVDSILYYMQVAGRRFPLRRFDITLSGERAGLVADALRHYYKRVRVV